jgi:hypothetical protein
LGQYIWCTENISRCGLFYITVEVVLMETAVSMATFPHLVTDFMWWSQVIPPNVPIVGVNF